MEVWRFGGLEVWRFGGLEVWEVLEVLEVWRLLRKHGMTRNDRGDHRTQIRKEPASRPTHRKIRRSADRCLAHFTAAVWCVPVLCGCGVCGVARVGSFSNKPLSPKNNILFSMLQLTDWGRWSVRLYKCLQGGAAIAAAVERFLRSTPIYRAAHGAGLGLSLIHI